mmetsp:Transcript_92547/g.299463  ORF Transcript_92547/g.299463 Transcript_92547/m.299463 type:complete len:261 (-) Transcript_92547:222-1004(-)
MQVLWRSADAVSSSFRSFEVASKSPSAVAFFSLLCAMPCFASANSFFAYLISSSRDCLSMPKLCTFAPSAPRSAPNCSCAFSSRSSNVPRIPPLWLSYAATSGAPLPSSASPLAAPCESWSMATSCFASAELSVEACTSVLRARAMPAAFFSCSMEAPPFCICSSMIRAAPLKDSLTSTNSFSSFKKTACSFSRMSVAAFKSFSSVAMLAESSSTFEVKESMMEVSSSIAAIRSATSFLADLISKAKFLDRSSHHSANSV